MISGKKQPILMEQENPMANIDLTGGPEEQMDQADVEKNKVMAVLAYIFFPIPLLLAKDSKFVRFHTNQGLLIVLVNILILLLSNLFGGIAGLLYLVTQVFWIMGLIGASSGKAKPLPLIGGIRLIKDFSLSGQRGIVVAVAAIIFYFSLILFALKDPEVIYNDAGFNYTQLTDFIESGYSSFAYHYAARDVDSELRLIPYTLPWITRIGADLYLQYPPWFLFTALPFYRLFGNYGFLVLNLLAVTGILYLFYLLFRDRRLPLLGFAMALLFYFFGTSVSFYTLHFHENMLAWLLSGCAFLFALRAVTDDYSKYNLFLYGFFAGLATVYRLELMIALFPIGVHLAFFNFKLRWKESLFAGLGFAIPISIFLMGNQLIHGHPLSLRYVINVAHSDATTLSIRLSYISTVLFDRGMGLFVQSPWVLLVPAVGFLYREDRRMRIASLWFVLSTLTVLVALPNHGSHFAPRYLFGLMPAAAFVIGAALTDLLTEKGKRGSWSGRASIAVIALTLLFSLSAFVKIFRTQLRNEEAIARTNRALNELPDDRLIVFREYASPQNAQYSLAHKRYVVVPDGERAHYLLNNLSHIQGGRVGFTIAFPIITDTGETVAKLDTHEKRIRFLRSVAGLNLHDFGKMPSRLDYRFPYLLVDYD
jgi:uncharacterized membrane protein